MDSDRPFDIDLPSDSDVEPDLSITGSALVSPSSPPAPVASTSKHKIHNGRSSSFRDTAKSSVGIIHLDDSDEEKSATTAQVAAAPAPRATSKPSNQPTPIQRAPAADVVGLSEAEEAQLARIESEIDSVTAQIVSLQEYKTTLSRDRQKLKTKQAGPLRVGLTAGADGVKRGLSLSSSSSAAKETNYLTQKFEWMEALKAKVKEVWNIEHYRSVQEGILNAVLQGRDCVAVMPTGAGKSLTYQAPALLLDGLTVVISPLLSLASDQVFHLNEHGIEAVAFNSATPKYEATALLRRIGQGPAKGEKEIKLLYVTPEKIVKSKTLTNALQKAYDDSRLARIAIDEAHCCSSLGHDYRPDYSKLALLKNLWPETPIIALSATCPPRVLENVLKILKLKATTPGEQAKATGTVFFSTPLFRHNLRFQVVPRPSQAQEALEALAAWIMQRHPNQCGIVYCLSQNDCQKMAQGLRDCSDNKIKSAVYHAGMVDQEKERIHIKWRTGGVQVICATTAFGMGIDKPDVRFVAHATPAKSFEGLYQESGRAGRDGHEVRPFQQRFSDLADGYRTMPLQSDCIVWYRPGQDVARLSSLTMRETDGTAKLLDLMGYLNDHQTCRKLLFARYFRDQYTTDSDAPCGHCDNCKRGEETKKTQDLSDEVWRIVKMCQAAFLKGGRLSFLQLCDLVRGLGGGTFGTAGGGGKGGSKGAKDKIDVPSYGGKISTLNKEETELVVAQLLADRVLGFHFTSNAYSDLAYVCPGKYSQRWLRFSQDNAAAEMEYVMVLPVKTKVNSRKRKSTGVPNEAPSAEKSNPGRKRSKVASAPDSDEEEAAEELSDPVTPPVSKKKSVKTMIIDDDDDDDEEEAATEGDDVWDTIL